MASLIRAATLVSILLVGPGCYSPPHTRGGDEAVAMYRRSAQSERALTLPPSTGAPEAAAEHGAVPLGVDAAIALAKKNSAKLAALEASVAVADAAVDAAGQRKNPELRVTNVRVGRAIDAGQVPRIVPRLRFSPERPGEIPAQKAEARAASNEVRAEARLEEMAIEAEVRWLFDEVLLLDAEIAAGERAASTRRALAKAMRDRLASEMATSVDVSITELHAIEADVQLAERRSRRALVVAELLDRIGRPPGTKLELLGDPRAWPPPRLPPESALIEAALKRSPRVTAAAAGIDRASARVDAEKTRRWPWFRFVEVGYEIDPSTSGASGGALWTVGLGVEVPILSTNGGAVRQAEASRTRARQRLEAEVEAITREVRARLREVNASAALVSQFRAEALPVLEHATVEAARGVESGAIDVLRALTIDERRSQVELKLLELVRRHRSAVDALRRAVGGPLVSPATPATE